MPRIVVLGAGFAGLWADLGAARTRDELGTTVDDLVIPVVVLVVAKAPVPGQAKTRLAASVGDTAAADIAAAALLDTLDAVAAAPVAARVVALTGELSAASYGAEITAGLADFTVVPQRGAGFAERLANAHIDAAAVSAPLRPARAPAISCCTNGPVIGWAKTSATDEFIVSGSATSSPTISTTVSARTSRLDAATSMR